VFNEVVRQAQAKHGNLQATFGENPFDFGAGATDHGILFEADQQGMVPGEFGDQLCIDRLDEAHVDDRGIESLAGSQCGREQAAEGEQGDVLALAANFALAKRQCIEIHAGQRAAASAAWVANQARAVQGIGGGEHPAAFRFVGRRHHHHVRDAGGEGKVECAVMGWAVGTNQAAAVNGEDYWQVLQRDVVDQLVVGALQEGRVNRHDRLQAFASQAGGKGDCVLLGNPDVVVAIWVFGREAEQARAFAHGRGDPDQP